MEGSWKSISFLNPARDGAVLPILHLNGYKIANPTVLGRASDEEVRAILEGHGYEVHFVEGDDPAYVHQAFAATLDRCYEEIRAIQREAREGDPGVSGRPRWPAIVLRTPRAGPVPKRWVACPSRAPSAPTRCRCRTFGPTRSSSRCWRSGCALTAPKSSSTPMGS